MPGTTDLPGMRGMPRGLQMTAVRRDSPWYGQIVYDSKLEAFEEKSSHPEMASWKKYTSSPHQ